MAIITNIEEALAKRAGKTIAREAEEQVAKKVTRETLDEASKKRMKDFSKLTSEEKVAKRAEERITAKQEKLAEKARIRKEKSINEYKLRQEQKEAAIKAKKKAEFDAERAIGNDKQKAIGEARGRQIDFDEHMGEMNRIGPITKEVHDKQELLRKEASKYKNAVEDAKELNSYNKADITNRLDKDKYKSKLGYAKHKQARTYDDAIKSIDDEDFNNPLLKKIASDNDIDVKSINKEMLMNGKTSAIRDASEKDLGLRDLAAYHKVPQKAVGVASTAWLVSRLANSGGQQTNSQLYGQQPM